MKLMFKTERRLRRITIPRVLESVNAEDLSLFSIESDLAAHGTEFLRFFDVSLPDPALLPRRLRKFNQETKRLFMDGRILHESNTGTVTAIVFYTLTSSKATYLRKEARHSAPSGWGTTRP